MKNIIFTILGLVILTSLVFSCQNEKSLQQFIVTQQEKPGIISFDLSASMLALNDEMQTPENSKTLKSIKKATILVSKINTSNNSLYLSEKEQLKLIFKEQKYGELMRFGKGIKGAKVFMVGTDDAINELIVFANDDTLGWLLIRIMGKNMQPENIIKLVNKIDFEKNDINFSSLTDLFKKTDF